MSPPFLGTAQLLACQLEVGETPTPSRSDTEEEILQGLSTTQKPL